MRFPLDLAACESLRVAVENGLSEFNFANGRECGECQECCRIKAIAELRKPQYQECAHQCATGCAIHPTRPKECAEYGCLWRGNLIIGDERRRPDKLGLIFETAGDQTSGNGWVVAWETRPNARLEPTAAFLLRTMADGVLVIVRHHGGRYASPMGPTEKICWWYSLLARDGEVEEAVK